MEKCLDEIFPVEAIIDKILSVPKLFSLLRKTGPGASQEDPEVSFQWKNPDFRFRNPGFLLKNVDFIL